MRGQLTKNIKIVSVLSYASGTADRSSSVVDAAGADGVMFITHFAAVATGAVVAIKAKHADAATDATTLSSGADIAGTSQTVADDDDNQVFIIDIYKPEKRYLQLVIDNDATNASAQSAVAVLYQVDTSPTTHGTGSGVGEGAAAVNVEAFVSPASGTA